MQVTLNFDGEISDETLKRFPYLGKHGAKSELSGEMGWITLMTRLVSTRLPKMVLSMYGPLGLCLLPLHILGTTSFMALKLLILNPIGLSEGQDEISFEVKTPIILDAGDSFRFGFQRIYSKHVQETRRQQVASRFVALHGVWWERIKVFRPIFAGTYTYSEKTDSVLIDLPLWAPHLLCGTVNLMRDSKTKQLVVAGKMNCWKSLRPTYRKLVASTFVPYNQQLLDLPVEELTLSQVGEVSELVDLP